MSSSISRDTSWLSVPQDWRELAARGLEFRGVCPECGDAAGRSTREEGWKLRCCGKQMVNHPEPSAEALAEWQAWADKVDREHEEWKEKYKMKAGAGDWGKGHDIFQLPLDCPDRIVHSAAEMKAVYAKYGLDADSHRFKPGQGPGTENQRRRNGAVSLDNHDRDLGY